jgi:hypothetical protein
MAGFGGQGGVAEGGAFCCVAASIDLSLVKAAMSTMINQGQSQYIRLVLCSSALFVELSEGHFCVAGEGTKFNFASESSLSSAASSKASPLCSQELCNNATCSRR